MSSEYIAVSVDEYNELMRLKNKPTLAEVETALENYTEAVVAYACDTADSPYISSMEKSRAESVLMDLIRRLF